MAPSYPVLRGSCGHSTDRLSAARSAADCLGAAWLDGFSPGFPELIEKLDRFDSGDLFGRHKGLANEIFVLCRTSPFRPEMPATLFAHHRVPIRRPDYRLTEVRRVLSSTLEIATVSTVSSYSN